MRLQEKRFRVVRRGKIAVVMLAAIFLMSCLSPLLANNKPLVIVYQGQWYFPLLHVYPETEFGGFFETEANYKDEFVAEEITRHGWWLWPPVRFSFDTINYDVSFPSPPSAVNWLGVDDQGRDVLARILYGTQISLLFAFGLTMIVAILALCFGAGQGYYGGLVDLIGQRITEIWGAIPAIFIVMIMASLVQPGPWILLLILSLLGWHHLAQQVRAEVLRIRQLDYVQAAIIAGVSDRRIIFTHVLPNAVVALVSNLPFIFAGALGALITLDFLGFGLPAGYPSLGELLAQGKNNLQAPWLGMIGCFYILVLVTSVVLIGEMIQELAARRSSVVQPEATQAEKAGDHA
ncbi:ABC transporter permease [Vibrio mangrovi]|uniref:ABC transporter permease n=1 Tax=Vibrio mangrovi TaxID=474394 RepID=A0A1Y6IQL3_9VIBR|nr:ABC transporter permease [Vibrio mangrovi]MDW6003277.1 ABC transporter permease [Vibrio mangrovi]SMR99934.1 Inner membrane ABC transporter permease protein YejE [Vibrio mangrovi]